MGSLPYEPHPRDDQKGGARSPLETPAWEETCLEFLRILPWLRYKKIVSIRTKRNIYLFNRAAAGASLTARPQIR